MADLKLGADTPSAVYVGSTAATAVYAGADKVWPNDIALVSSFTVTVGSNPTSIPFDLSTNFPTMRAGDVVVLAIAFQNASLNRTLTAPSGYTAIQDSFSNSTYDLNYGTAYKAQTGTLDTTVNYAISTGGGDAVIGLAMLFRNVSSVTTAFSVGTGLPNSPSVSGAVTGDWVVAIGGQAATAGQVNALTAPSGYTLIDNVETSNANNESMLAAAYITTPSNPEDPPAFGGGYNNVAASNADTTLLLVAA